jgi:endonuclease/exonuclease/phosphatase family metal-dependent hydrolase
MKINIYVIVILAALFLSCSSAPIFNPKVNDVNLGIEDDNEFSIITYNIQSVFGKEENKVTALTEYLATQRYDFVVMQEVFDENVRNNLIEELDVSFYQSLISRIDYSSFPSIICQDAGLYSTSRFPMIDLSPYDFGDNTDITNGAINQMLIKEFSISLDFMANKSALGTLHQINDSTTLFLFTAHVQALSSRNHKTTQLKQINAFIQNAVFTVLKNGVVDNPKNLIVLLTGDFNYDAYSENDVEILQKYLGNPRDLYKEYNPVLQEYSLMLKFISIYRRVDYIFAYDYIGNIPLCKVNAKSINITDVLDKNKESVSDHLALKATLRID